MFLNAEPLCSESIGEIEAVAFSGNILIFLWLFAALSFDGGNFPITYTLIYVCLKQIPAF